MKLTDIQKTVIRGYAGGDHAWLAEQEEVTDDDLEGMGDSLIKFLLWETGPEGECEDVDQALSRLNNIVDEISGAIRALEDGRDAIDAV